MASGYLTKVGFKSGKWQRRHCSLVGDVLTYSASQSSLLKNTFKLDEHACVQTVSEGSVPLHGLASGVDAKPCGPHSFKARLAAHAPLICPVQIISPWKNSVRTFYFTADNEQDRDRWVAAIIAELQTKFPSPKHAQLLDGALAEERPLARVPLFIEVVSANGLPVADLGGSSDPYVRISVVDDSGQNRTGWLRGPVRPLTLSPIWRAYFSLRMLATSTNLVNIEVLDRDRLSADDPLATCSVLVGQLSMRPTTFRLNVPPSRARCEPTLCLRRVVPRYRRKILYVVRHGRSKWNEAVASRDPRALHATDHPLSLEGVQQARELNKLWAVPLSSDCRLELLKVDLIMSSPLTRALQTALIAFANHPAVAKSGIQLISLAREMKTPLGRDTVGQKVGPAILHRAITELRDLVGSDASAYTAVKIDPFDCQSQWWSPTLDMDTESERVERLEQLRSLLHCIKFHTGILVSHSIVMHEFLRRFAIPDLLSNPATAAIINDKMPHANLLRVELDLDAPDGPAVVGVSYPWLRKDQA